MPDTWRTVLYIIRPFIFSPFSLQPGPSTILISRTVHNWYIRLRSPGNHVEKRIVCSAELTVPNWKSVKRFMRTNFRNNIVTGWFKCCGRQGPLWLIHKFHKWNTTDRHISKLPVQYTAVPHPTDNYQLLGHYPGQLYVMISVIM